MSKQPTTMLTIFSHILSRERDCLFCLSKAVVRGWLSLDVGHFILDCFLRQMVRDQIDWTEPLKIKEK